jgi:hypothetical protein
MEKIERLNLINSCTGYKSAELFQILKTNVAILVALPFRSNPAMIVYHAPTTVPRDTYKNIKETGYFTINHITAAMISGASSDQL